MTVDFFEYATAFTIGLLLLYLVSYFFKVRDKVLLILTINSLAGALIYIIICICGAAKAAGGAAFLCGLLGTIGCAIVLLYNIL
jgi:hypothetical protein